jgi:hypothetical protein
MAWSIAYSPPAPVNIQVSPGAGSVIAASVQAILGTAIFGAVGALALVGQVPSFGSPPETFDYYVSPTGSDSNPGTVAEPWAITSLRTVSSNFSLLAGQRIGFLPGTYNVSTLMQNDPVVGALQFQGGSATLGPTVYASCDSDGNYSPRTATLDALSSGGLYGGFNSTGPGNYDGPIVSNSGEYPTTYNLGYLTIDGLVFTGFSYKCVRIGGGSSGDGPGNVQGVRVQNCLFTGGGFNSGNPIDNISALWIDCCTGAVITNNRFENNAGYQSGGMDHLNAIICWGSPTLQCTGTVITYNTVINAGNIYGKEINIQGTTVAYNYVDTSMFTVQASSYCISDFTGADSPGLTQTTAIHHNICIAGGGRGLGGPTLSNTYGATTPYYWYSNLVIQDDANNYPAAWLNSQSSGNIQNYNNIYVGVAGTGESYGSFVLNPAGPVIWNFNLLPESGFNYTIYENGALTTALGTYSSVSAFAAGLEANGGLTGAEANSVLSDTPLFTNSGTLAELYQLQESSPAKGTGYSNGTGIGGFACDMGPWGYDPALGAPPTQIGSNF